MKKIIISSMIAVPFLSACDEVTLYRGDTSTEFDGCNSAGICKKDNFTFDSNTLTLTKTNPDGSKEISTFPAGDTNDYQETSRTIICLNGKTTTFYPTEDITTPGAPSSPQDPSAVCTRM